MNKLATWLCAVAIVIILGVCWQVSALTPAADAVLERSGVRPVGSITRSWISGGVVVVFTSTRTPSETAAEWAKRAREEYDAMLAAFPMDP